MNFVRQGFRKLSSDRQANRQIDTTEIITTPASRVVIKRQFIICYTSDNFPHSMYASDYRPNRLSNTEH